jgi:DnaK suppressor protein
MRRRGLNRRTLGEMEHFLRRRRSELTAAVNGRLRDRRREEAGRSSDSAVWATETLGDEIQAALLDRQSREIAQIEAALERLGHGRYGICHECGEAIEVQRLRALPFAQRCTACQADSERGARRPPAPGLLPSDAGSRGRSSR